MIISNEKIVDRSEKIYNSGIELTPQPSSYTIKQVALRDKYHFELGVSWAEDQMKNISIEFAMWCDNSPYTYVDTHKVWVWYDDDNNYTNEQFFDKFLKERI